MNTNAKTNILLIEDNSGDYNLVKILLKDASTKHELFHAETYFEGIEIIKEKEIDLVLLDLSLPDSSGFKTLSNFRDKFPMIPVIVLTGVNNEIVGNQAIKAGASDYLVKGQFDGKLLGRSIRYSLHRFNTQLQLEETARDLSLSEKRYVEAQEMGHFGNWEMDIVANTMQWTDEVYRIFGYRPGSIDPTFSDYMNYVHSEDKKIVETFFEQSTKDGKLNKLEHRLLIDGRNIKYVAVQAKVHFESITNKIILVGVIQDITERKVSEKLILERNISKGTSKLREEALSDMSFHIRTPMSSIVNLLYILENSSINNQQREYIEGLKTSVDDLSMMTNNLLNFSLLVSEKLSLSEEEIDLKEFLSSIAKVAKIKTDNIGASFNLEGINELPDKVRSDANKVTQIIYNLIDYIVTKSPLSDLKINASVDQQNEHNALLIDFYADGQALTQEDQKDLLEADKLLEVYNGDSSGEPIPLLGMGITSKLIKMIGGSYQVDAQDQHTRYMVRIPVKEIRKLRFNEQQKPEVPIKILLVEDHFLNQIATKKVLTTWSDLVSVDIAENGLVGVEKLREHGYDLILMDIQMPIMGGIEATAKIREQSKIPIIALTANSSKQEADRCFDAGMNDYMAKPFKPQDLYAKIMAQLIPVNNA